MKPKLTLSVLEPVRIVVKDVRWHTEIEKCHDLGAKNAFFTYLRIKNTGTADAENCACAYVPSQEAENNPKEFFLRADLPLAYSGLIPTEAEIVVGWYQISEIIVSGRSILGVTSKMIPKHGGEAMLLLAFTVQGTSQMILGVTEGAAVYPLEPITILLRTSADGKLHKVRLEPDSSGRIKAEIL